MAKMRAGYHESQTQRETFDAEAKRYKVLLKTVISKKKLPFSFYIKTVCEILNADSSISFSGFVRKRVEI